MIAKPRGKRATVIVQRARRERALNGVLRAAIYTRNSDPDEENTVGSHDFQEKDCRRAAEAAGHQVVGVYSDDFSGRFLHERPALSRLRQDVRDGKIDVVWIWKFDRFSRSMAQKTILVQELRKHDCQICSATEAITDTPEGRLLEGVLGCIAEFELERTLERSTSGLAYLRDHGLMPCGGRARYGYRYDVDLRARVIVEAEAQWVRRIFAWYLEGLSSNVIADRLNAIPVPCPNEARGIRHRGDAPPRWVGSTIRQFLHDESYVGAPMTHGKKRSRGDVYPSGNLVLEPTDPSEWWQSAAATPAIIDRATFDRVQEVMKTRWAYHESRNDGRFLLLRGMVECAVCGRSMSPRYCIGRGGKRYDYYGCISTQMRCRCGNGDTPIDWLDGVVWAEVVRVLSDRDEVERQFASVLKEARAEDVGRDIDAHAAAIGEARAAIRRLTLRLEATDDPEILAPLEERLAVLRRQIASHQADVARLEAKQAVVQNRRATLDRWVEACARGRAYLDAASQSPERRRDLLVALAVRVVARKKEVTIRGGVPLVNDVSQPWGTGSMNEPHMPFHFAVTG